MDNQKEYNWQNDHKSLFNFKKFIHHRRIRASIQPLKLMLLISFSNKKIANSRM